MAKDCIQNMALIDAPWFQLNDTMRDDLVNRGFLVLRGCNRHMIIGRRDEIEKLRQEFQQPHDYYEGAEAYGRLLQNVTGQLGRMRGESQIVSQFKGTWKVYCEANPDHCKEFSYLYESIIADNAMIRSRITSDVVPAFYESTARRIADQKPNDTVLIVAGLDATGQKPSESTRHLVRQLASNRHHGIKHLYITHPDPNLVRRIAGALRLSGLKINPEPIAFKKVFEGPESLMPIDRVFVTLPMDQFPEADRAMCEAWAERETYPGKLIHLGGGEHNERETRGVWKEHQFWSSAMPEDVSAQQKQEQDRNDALIEIGGIAAVNCGESRAAGKNPVPLFLTLPRKDYIHQTGLDTGPASLGG